MTSCERATHLFFCCGHNGHVVRTVTFLSQLPSPFAHHAAGLPKLWPQRRLGHSSIHRHSRCRTPRCRCNEPLRRASRDRARNRAIRIVLHAVSVCARDAAGGGRSTAPGDYVSGPHLPSRNYVSCPCLFSSTFQPILQRDTFRVWKLRLDTHHHCSCESVGRGGTWLRQPASYGVLEFNRHQLYPW